MLIEIIRGLAIFGLALALYSFYVDSKLKNEKNYRAACDINNKVSCSKAFKSKYGKTFGVSNSFYGILFYCSLLVVSYYNVVWVFYLAVLSVIGSFYLAYLLYFKVKGFCIICNGIYLVNLLIFILSLVVVK